MVEPVGIVVEVVPMLNVCGVVVLTDVDRIVHFVVVAGSERYVVRCCTHEVSSQRRARPSGFIKQANFPYSPSPLSMCGAGMLHLRELRVLRRVELFRETERLWENWLITKTTFPSPRCCWRTRATHDRCNEMRGVNLAFVR